MIKGTPTHLHGVDCALSNDASHGPGNEPLQDAQSFFVPADQTLNLGWEIETCQWLDRAQIQYFIYLHTRHSSYLLICHKFQGRLRSNFDDIHAISSPQGSHTAFFNHLHQASHQAHVAGSRPINLQRNMKPLKQKNLTRVPLKSDFLSQQLLFQSLILHWKVGV